MTEISRRGVIVVVAGGTAAVAAARVAFPRIPSIRPTWGRVIHTSFGSVVLLGSSRLVTGSTGETGHGRPQGQHGHDVSETPVASAVHGAWTDAVLVDVEVHNDLSRAIELSPGQFRVRVAGGPTVSLYSADHDAGSVEPASTTTMRISYLAPPPDQPLSLEFADTGASGPVRLGRLDSTGGL